MRYQKGERRRLLVPMHDDNDGFERVTPAGSVVEVAEVFPDQESCYLIGCPATGGTNFFSEMEVMRDTEPVDDGA
jgi:hypothetical protein